MKGKGVRKRLGSPSTVERLTSIELSLREIQKYMDQSQVKMSNIDRLIRDVEEIKRNTKKSGFSFFRKREKDERKKQGGIGQIAEILNDPAVQSMLKRSGDKASKGFNVVDMLSLLQNPAVQSIMEQNNKNVKKGKKKKAKRLGHPIDWAEIMGLIQNPAFLSMLNQFK